MADTSLFMCGIRARRGARPRDDDGDRIDVIRTCAQRRLFGSRRMLLFQHSLIHSPLKMNLTAAAHDLFTYASEQGGSWGARWDRQKAE